MRERSNHNSVTEDDSRVQYNTKDQVVLTQSLKFCAAKGVITATSARNLSTKEAGISKSYQTNRKLSVIIESIENKLGDEKASKIILHIRVQISIA